ncbi:hypothetical protein OC844_004868 [Tilletia horrida]|nr:hypothetical protein OC844_004868 [Tilletia horrida]
MVQLKPTFSVLSTALLLSASLSDVGAVPVNSRIRPFQGNAVTPGKGVSSPALAPNQYNGQAFPAVQPLVNVENAGNIGRRQDADSAASYVDPSTVTDDGTTTADDSTSYATDDVEPASFAADVAQSPESQGQTLNWFLADTDTDSPEINMAGPGGPDDGLTDGTDNSQDGSGSGIAGSPNQYAVKAPTAGMKSTETDATSPAWRAVPCNGEMFEGAGQTSSDANQYLVVPMGSSSAGAKFDDGQYHPGQVSASPSVSAASKRSIYHRLGEDKKSGKKGSKSGKKAGKKHKKGKKSKKGKKGKKALKHKKHAQGAKAPASAPAKRSNNGQVLRVDGSGININLVGGDLDPSIYRHDDLIRLRTRGSHDHAHIHDHGKYDDDWYYGHHSQHWREHHGYYRHGGDHVHEHAHIHKRDLFAPGTRGTVAVLQPLVGSLLDTGLAQQVATLVLAPLSSDAAAAGVAKSGLNLKDTTADATDSSSSSGTDSSDSSISSANSFLLSPSSTQPGTKLMLVDSPNNAMLKPANMSDWRQVQLQATVFNLAAADPTAAAAAAGSGVGSAASMAASSPGSAAGAATGAASAVSGAAAAGSGSGTGATTPSGQFCATIDTRPPSTLRMELCNQNSAGTSQEFLYDPVTGQLTPFVDGSSTTQSASIQGKRQAPAAGGSSIGAASGTGSASASATTPAGPAPASVKLVFIADAPSTADTPPAAPADVEDAAMAAADDAASSATGAAATGAAATGSGMGSAVMDDSTSSMPMAKQYAVAQQYDASNSYSGSAMDDSSAAAEAAEAAQAVDEATDAYTMSSGSSASAAGAATDATGASTGYSRRALDAVRRWFSSESVAREM